MRRTIALIGLLTLVVAGCGHKSATPQATLAAASSKTTDGTTARMSFTASIKPKTSGAKPLDIKGTGVFNLKTRKGLMSVKLPPFAGQDLGTIEVRLLGSTLYEKLPDKLASFAGAKGWGKIDVEKLAKDNGFDVTSITQGQATDPTQALDLLKSAADDVTEVGTAKVRGVDTTHYRATLDAGKALAANNELDATAKANLGSLYNNLKAPADVWIDKQGRLRKMTYSFDVSKIDPATLGGNAKAATSVQQISAVDFTLELFDFGVPVSVTAPPANEVTDLSGDLNAGLS